MNVDVIDDDGPDKVTRGIVGCRERHRPGELIGAEVAVKTPDTGNELFAVSGEQKVVRPDTTVDPLRVRNGCVDAIVDESGEARGGL